MENIVYHQSDWPSLNPHARKLYIMDYKNKLEEEWGSTIQKGAYNRHAAVIFFLSSLIRFIPSFN